MNLSDSYAGRAQLGGDDRSDIHIRSYTSQGVIQGMGSVEVEASEILVPDRRHVSYFVRITGRTLGEYPDSATAIIQLDNVPKLLAAIGKLADVLIKTDRFSFSEVEYEVDQLKLIVYNDSRGKHLFLVSINNVSVHFESLNRLRELGNLVAKAKMHIDQHMIEF